jgi:hypothetical protein
VQLARVAYVDASLEPPGGAASPSARRLLRRHRVVAKPLVPSELAREAQR